MLALVLVLCLDIVAHRNMVFHYSDIRERGCLNPFQLPFQLSFILPFILPFVGLSSDVFVSPLFSNSSLISTCKFLFFVNNAGSVLAISLHLGKYLATRCSIKESEGASWNFGMIATLLYIFLATPRSAQKILFSIGSVYSER